MKRLWSTPKFASRNEIRARKFQRRRHKARLTGPRTELRSTPAQQELLLKAPRVLKLFDAPSDTLDYCYRLETHIVTPNTRVFLDLSGVLEFTTDALLLLRAILGSPSRGRRTEVRGNLPSDPVVAAEFKESGFFTGIAHPPANLPNAKGLMLNKSHDRVYASIAAELVDFARAHSSMSCECAKACWQSLVELMTNTHNHAATKRGTHRRPHNSSHGHKWFASVYCRDHVAYFNFIDLGVGILNSAPVKNFLQALRSSMSAHGQIRLLTDAFCGRVGSATGRPGRGLGLPKIRGQAKEHLLPHLEVLTSNIVGCVGDLNFRSVDGSLHGTAFRWHTDSGRGKP